MKEKDVNVIKVTKLDLSEVCSFSLYLYHCFLVSFTSSFYPLIPYTLFFPPSDSLFASSMTQMPLTRLVFLARALTTSTAISTGQQKPSNGPTPQCLMISSLPDLNTLGRKERRGTRRRLRPSSGWMFSMSLRECIIY